MINEAYLEGEAGIVADSFKEESVDIPFERVTEPTLLWMLRRGSLMLAMRGGEALGCVKVNPNCDQHDSRVGDIDMLCVDKSV